jgi:hypothetical protein
MRNRRFVRSCNDGDCDVVTTSTCEARPGFVCPVAGTMWGRVSCALRRGCSPNFDASCSVSMGVPLR